MLRSHIGQALQNARFEQLEDGTFSGEIPDCPGTIAFGQSVDECRRELEAALEDWLLSALRHGDFLPVINGIDLNPRVETARAER